MYWDRLLHLSTYLNTKIDFYIVQIFVDSKNLGGATVPSAYREWWPSGLLVTASFSSGIFPVHIMKTLNAYMYNPDITLDVTRQI